MPDNIKLEGSYWDYNKKEENNNKSLIGYIIQ